MNGCAPARCAFGISGGSVPRKTRIPRPCACCTIAAQVEIIGEMPADPAEASVVDALEEQQHFRRVGVQHTGQPARAAGCRFAATALGKHQKHLRGVPHLELALEADRIRRLA